MGLDVYVYRSENREEQNKVIEAASERCEAIWKEKLGGLDYKDATEAQKDDAAAACKAYNLSVGLEDNGTHPGQTDIKIDSAKYPKHYFKIGYFRSSYNEGGINRVLDRLGLPTLHDIFDAPEEYEFVPDWAQAMAKATSVLKLYRAADRSFDVMRVSPNHFRAKSEFPDAEEAVRKLYLDEIAKEKDSKLPAGSYGNINGDFFMNKPLRVRALMPGVNNIFGRETPCVYVVYDREKDEDKEPDGGDYYEQALEIVIETCAWVLAQPDPQNYYLHWSS